MTELKLVIIMGSKSDFSFARQIGEFLKKEGFPIQSEYNISSAHKTPDVLLEKLRKYEESADSIVYITIAGLSDALSGVVAGLTRFPVIACPPDIDKRGLTKLFSSLMTPKGIAVTLVSNPENAALAAAKIFSLIDGQTEKKVAEYMRKKRNEVIRSDKEISEQKQLVGE